MATSHLASWACTLQYLDVPQDVIQAAVRSFYNWTGCAIGGSHHPATTIAVSNSHHRVISIAGQNIMISDGSIGAAVAVSKLLRISVSQTTHAIGVAATQVVGLREMFGSHSKSFHPGRAAQSGLMAAVLAQGGYTSSEQALEAKRGWANVFGARKSGITEDLDKWLGMHSAATEHGVGLFSEGVGRLEILRKSFKPFPCGIVIHPIIDACVQIHNDMKNQGLKVQNIESVHAKVHPLVLELTGKRKSKDGLEGKFNVFHGAAIGMNMGRERHPNTNRIVQHQNVINIRDKIDAESDKSLGADETIMAVTMNDGKRWEEHVEHAVGSTEVPMNDDMLQQNFVDQCVSGLGDNVQAASEACWNIESVNDMADVAKLL